MLDRTEDAIYAIRSLEISNLSGVSKDLNHLRDRLEKEKKIAKGLSNLRLIGIEKVKESSIQMVFKRYPEKAMRYLVARLSSEFEKNKRAKRFHRKKGIEKSEKAQKEVEKTLQNLIQKRPELLHLLWKNSIEYNIKEVQAVAHSLKLMKHKFPLSLLVHLKSNNFHAIENVLSVIRVFRYKKALPILKKMLKDYLEKKREIKLSVQVNICKTFQSFSDLETIPLLLQLLNSKNIRVATAAADALGNMKQRGTMALGALLSKTKLGKENEYSVRLAFHSWKASFKIDKEEALLRAIQILRDKKTAKILHQWVWNFLANQQNRTFLHFIEKIDKVGRFHSSKLYHQKLDSQTAKVVVEKFSKILRLPLPEVLQRKSIQIIMEIEDRRVLEILQKLLFSNRRAIRREAAFALCILRPSQKYLKVKDIGKILLYESDSYVKIYLCWLLARFSHKADFQKIVQKNLKKKNSDFFLKTSYYVASGLGKNIEKIEELISDLSKN